METLILGKIKEITMRTATSFPFKRAYFLPFPPYAQMEVMHGTNRKRRLN